MVCWIDLNGHRTHTSMLALTNITRSEAGEYRCEASNQCGNASRTITLVVQCKLNTFADSSSDLRTSYCSPTGTFYFAMRIAQLLNSRSLRTNGSYFLCSARQRDVCESPSLIVLQYPIVLAQIGCLQ